MRKLLVLLLLFPLDVPQPARAGWGTGEPCPVGRYEWRQRSDDADNWGLFYDGEQVGGYRPSAGNFRWLALGAWGEPSPCPFAFPTPPVRRDICPCCGEDCRCSAGRPCEKPNCRCILPGAVVESDGSLNFGLNTKEIKRAPRHVCNGREVSKARLMEAIGKPALKDDSGELCLTVIGPEADRKGVIADLKASPLLSPWKDRIKVKDFDPSHWAVRDAGFVLTGHPTIYCQAPDGKVLHRQDDYRGAEALAEALRKADPSYAPQNDPDLNKPAGLSVPSLDSIGKWLESVPGYVWLGLALIAYLRFFNKEKVQ